MLLEEVVVVAVHPVGDAIPPMGGEPGECDPGRRVRPVEVDAAVVAAVAKAGDAPDAVKGVFPGFAAGAGEEKVRPAHHHIRRVGHPDGEPVALRAQADDAERVRGEAADRSETEEDLRLQPRLLLMPGRRDGQHAVVVGQERGEGLVQLASAAAPVGGTGQCLR
ncbi:hypothetical protein ACIO1C_00900 [Streptomyces sp. NPDC087420]|uniref:hypothetical protein n=1 Tax=Streptomyces sp. NPDC087420 TaxID=3365785 RepID=UPI0038389935